MTTPLPLIVGLGGINAAGRASFSHGYRRMVIDALSADKQDSTYQSLGSLMGVGHSSTAERQHILDHTLVRRIERWDTEAVRWQNKFDLQGSTEPNVVVLNKRQVPNPLPSGWTAQALEQDQVRVTISANAALFVPELRKSKVTSAGQIPSGFNPGSLYQSRNHPLGLQLTVFAASDALRSTGFTVEELKAQVAPDQFAVYASSAMGQLDAEGYGGMYQNSLTGRRVTAKNVPLGLAEMPADFVNAYVLGSAGGSAGIVGACASFLYNLKQGMEDIRSGAKRLVLVGNAEAPIVPEVIEGYRTMGALAEDEALMALDGSSEVNNRRACRPFSANCGFTVAESSVFTVLMDDALAMELGARVLGAVGDIFVNADGYKKSIPGPGIGNYLTVAKAMGFTRSLLGEHSLRHNTHMQAHGTSTPQNRVTESEILNSLAKTFGIQSWPIAAIKAYVGHSMAPASADQLSAVLGVWNDGWLPGITTVDHIADDVAQSNLNLPLQHLELDPKNQDAALINAKGFGGNNATGVMLSAPIVQKMLAKRWGSKAIAAYQHKAEAVQATADAYDAQMQNQPIESIYKFGEGVLEGSDLEVSDERIKVPGFDLEVDLTSPTPYQDIAPDEH